MAFRQTAKLENHAPYNCYEIVADLMHKRPVLIYNYLL